MSLWTVHPKYLDKQGLISLWREGLLAQKVLNGEQSDMAAVPAGGESVESDWFVLIFCGGGRCPQRI